MENIIVASDLSVRSDRAVRRAVRMAGRLGSALTVLHVVDSAMPARLAEQVRKEAHEALETYIASCKPAADQKISVSVVIGDPIIEIETEALSKKAELLIVGLHRDRGFLDLLKETTMERLIRTSSIPVLLVADAADHDYKSLLCGIDMSRACAHAIRVAHQVASDATLSLFHAFHAPYHRMENPEDAEKAALPFRKEAIQNLESWRQTYDVPTDLPEPMLVDASPGMALEQMMTKHNPDMLIMGAHTRSNLSRYILGGFTSRLVRNPPCDLLIAK